MFSTTCPNCKAIDYLFVTHVTLAVTGQRIEPRENGRKGTKLTPDGFYTGDQTIHLKDASTEDETVKCEACSHVMDLDDLVVDEDDEDNEEEAGDDLCDLCMTSGVNVERTTYCGKTIGIECGCEEENEDGSCGDCEECARGVAKAKAEEEEE